MAVARRIVNSIRRLAHKLRQPQNSLKHMTGLFLILLSACQGKYQAYQSTKQAAQDTDTAQTSTVEDDTAPADSPDYETLNDEELLRAAINGERNADETFKIIASQGGFPIKTGANTFLFACLCDSGPWSLTGMFSEWALLPMIQSGSIWWLETTIDDATDTLYKFSNGQVYIPDPYARRYGYDNNGEYSLVEAQRAHLERWHNDGNEDILARRIRVWVPENGHFDRTLFVHDAQNIFDPSAPWGGWKLQDSVPEKTLVVGVDNSIQRMDEYTHTTDRIDEGEVGGLGDAYANYLHMEIRPFIEDQYGVAEINGLMGASLGGLISLYTALRYPNAYDMAISLSGTVGWGRIELSNPTIIELFQNAGQQPFAIYIDSGGYGDCYDSDGDGIQDDNLNSPDNYCENLQFRDSLADLGYSFDVSLWHWHENGAEHNEAAWAARVWRPLSHFYSL